MVDQVRFQFGIRRLLLVTSMVAIVMAVAIRIGIAAQLFFGCILLFLCVWAFFRGRTFVAIMKELRQQRQDIVQRRSQLERELQRALRGRGADGPVAKNAPLESVKSRDC